MSREEAIEIIRKEYACVDADCDIERSCGKCELHMPSKEPILKAYEMAIQALSQEPCDAISREKVMDIISDYYNVHDTTAHEEEIMENMMERVEQLPPVTQKSGKWNEYYTSQKGNDVFNCKECGHTFVVTQGKDNMNYCPNCGADMRGVE